MTPSELQRLLIAPEIIVVDLALAALRALDRALLAEHPLLLAPPSCDDPLARHRARAVLRRAARLRLALSAYRRAVEDILRDANLPDDPF